MEKNVDHYMRLPYAVGLERDGDWYRAWARELPGCTAEARATEGVGELWERLEGTSPSSPSPSPSTGRRIRRTSRGAPRGPSPGAIACIAFLRRSATMNPGPAPRVDLRRPTSRGVDSRCT